MIPLAGVNKEVVKLDETRFPLGCVGCRFRGFRLENVKLSGRLFAGLRTLAG